MRYILYSGMALSIPLYWLTPFAAFYYAIPHAGETWSPIILVRRLQYIPWVVAQGSINVLFDLFLIVVPVPVVLRLQLQQRQKLGIIAIFMTGFL